jgi:hypothetical protein
MGWMKKARRIGGGNEKTHLFESQHRGMEFGYFPLVCGGRFPISSRQKGKKRIFPSKREAELEAFELVRGLENL